MNTKQLNDLIRDIARERGRSRDEIGGQPIINGFTDKLVRQIENDDEVKKQFVKEAARQRILNIWSVTRSMIMGFSYDSDFEVDPALLKEAFDALTRDDSFDPMKLKDQLDTILRSADDEGN